MAESFWTVANSADKEIIINRSRFIGRVFSISDEESVHFNLQELKEEFPDATHHCYGYVLGRGNNIQRFNDDGEPGGTAGMPILQVILQQEIEDVLVVVVRYFGGTKLGAGGLVRAYSKTAAEVLQKAGKKKMTLSRRCSITVDYGVWGALEYFLRQQGIPILDIDYQEDVTIRVITWMDWLDFNGMIIEFTNGKANCVYLDEIYYPWAIEG